MSKPRSTPRAAPRRRPMLVVDDADSMRTYLKNLLSLQGYEVHLAESGMKALELLDGDLEVDVVVLDVMMPGMDGLETLREIKSRRPEVPVIMLSVVGKAATIVEAMNLGASHYLNKPFEEQELDLALKRVLETESLKAERDELREKVRAHEERQGGNWIWVSDKMTRIHEVLEQVADADVTVLIHGESGVGKEVISRKLHELSNRRDEEFVKVNCAALPQELLESELFGYERGAFTGASGRKAGKFEIADGGTIFLDEIGEMSPVLQAKLLQVLQDGEFSPLGGQRDVRVDVRVVCATNRNLEEMVAQKTFREDLYYRLNVVNIFVPPLREREKDIPVLAEFFLTQYARKYARDVPSLSPDLLERFKHYPWPGNVRELENMVKRIVVLQSEEAIREELESVPIDVIGRELAPPAGAPAGRAASAPPQPELPPLPEDGELSLKDIGRSAALAAEREALRRVLAQTNWNRKKAAKILQVSYKTLLQKIKETGLVDS